MNPSTSSNRIAYIDIAKGIGILLVVMAHNDLSLVSPYLHRFIYAFHMPLFFFLSGYFFNSEVPFVKFFSKRFNSILKPYFFTIFLIYATSLSFTNMSFKTALGRIIKSMYATALYIDWVQLWFLPSLFITSLFAYGLYRFVLARIKQRAIRWLLLLTILVVGMQFSDIFFPFSITLFGKVYELLGLPYSLDLVLVSGFFYIAGNEVRKLSIERIVVNPWFMFITGILLIVIVAVFPYAMDFNLRLFELIPMNILGSFLGIAFTLAFSKQIELHTRRLSSVFEYIGQASLFILIFHVPIQEFWGKKILFMTDVPVLSTVVGFVAGVAFSLLFYEVFVKLNPVALFWYGRTPSLPSKQNNESDASEQKKQQT